MFPDAWKYVCCSTPLLSVAHIDQGHHDEGKRYVLLSPRQITNVWLLTLLTGSSVLNTSWENK